MEFPLERGNELLAHFLTHSNSVALVCVDRNGYISQHNSYFSNLMQYGAFLTGKLFLTCLLPESEKQFINLASHRYQQQKINFSCRNNQTLQLHCHIFNYADQTVILGEKLMLGNGAILKTLSSLNDDLAVTAINLQRENRKLGRKTICGGNHPPVAVCSYCRDVRNKAGKWKDMEESLTELAGLQFSHSICDTCLEEHHAGDLSKEADSPPTE